MSRDSVRGNLDDVTVYLVTLRTRFTNTAANFDWPTYTNTHKLAVQSPNLSEKLVSHGRHSLNQGNR